MQLFEQRYFLSQFFPSFPNLTASSTFCKVDNSPHSAAAIAAAADAELDPVSGSEEHFLTAL